LYLDEAEHCDDVVILYDGETPAQDAPRAFSERVRGRSWVVSGASGGVRAAQAKLSRRAGVIDSVIQADGVRLVAAEGVVFEEETLLAGLPGATLTAVEPRFEDAFMAIVHERAASASASIVEAPAAAAVVRGDRVAAGAVIEVENVQRRFGDFYAVKGVTFEVARGEVFGLLGANGAGKSTTFRMLCGLLPPSAGRLRVAGVDVRRAAAAARAKIGYMSQKFSLYGYLSVRQNMNFFSAAYGLSGRLRDERIAWALDQFQLADSADTRAADLALGFKQRLALACALMHEPDILFLDEPTSGVDPPARREFWRRINDLAEQRVTVLVTTHFLEEAEYCDRMAIMADGEILALGTPAEVKSLAGPREDRPRSMEEAFIALIEQRAAASAGGTS
ncbi:MAG: ATP-binding cassette domain-containing protein, partial [Planctomycetota bacterium]|nr:ATP-binding cassette domain-containing protein [Planctomycetota bacterium]